MNGFELMPLVLTATTLPYAVELACNTLDIRCQRDHYE